jgi:hypothetical protein
MTSCSAQRDGVVGLTLSGWGVSPRLCAESPRIPYFWTQTERIVREFEPCGSSILAVSAEHIMRSTCFSRLVSASLPITADWRRSQRPAWPSLRGKKNTFPHRQALPFRPNRALPLDTSHQKCAVVKPISAGICCSSLFSDRLPVPSLIQFFSVSQLIAPCVSDTYCSTTLY